MINRDVYTKIIEEICKSKNISEEELIYMLKEKEMRYLMILFLKKYDCWNEDEIKGMLNVKTKKSINYNYQKAEEKLLINKRFRDKYFELEEKIEAQK